MYTMSCLSPHSLYSHSGPTLPQWHCFVDMERMVSQWTGAITRIPSISCHNHPLCCLSPCPCLSICIWYVMWYSVCLPGCVFVSGVWERVYEHVSVCGHVCMCVCVWFVDGDYWLWRLRLMKWDQPLFNYSPTDCGDSWIMTAVNPFTARDHWLSVWQYCSEWWACVCACVGGWGAFVVRGIPNPVCAYAYCHHCIHLCAFHRGLMQTQYPPSSLWEDQVSFEPLRVCCRSLQPGT